MFALESTLAIIRDKVDSYRGQWYQEAVSAANCNFLPEHKRKHLRLNEFDEVCAHYRVTLTVPSIDSILVSLDDRFSVKHEALCAGFQLLHAVVIKNKNWKTYLKIFVDEYSDDIDSDSVLSLTCTKCFGIKRCHVIKWMKTVI